MSKRFRILVCAAVGVAALVIFSALMAYLSYDYVGRTFWELGTNPNYQPFRIS